MPVALLPLLDIGRWFPAADPQRQPTAIGTYVLASAIKIMVDRDKRNGMFWLTGSEKFELIRRLCRLHGRRPAGLARAIGAGHGIV